MPLYDFMCRDCGEIFEEIASPDCTGGEPCPSCGSKQTDRRLSAHCAIPGSGVNRLPSGLLRGGGAKMEKVPMPKKAIPQRPKTGGCPSAGGCPGAGGCSAK
ncbi:zinc ribbon domain-containing protein [Desulfovibrio subterraneus]|uniref:FmdB family zinc ribbon protein n=1 Tax=Desulfovibrio subterraneus TaxID=2718620 RepID=UPI0022B91341|nr:zinc ribbon domain-containing protein [Desulfovibrio subterraneus]WBF68158.1 zinc ribbon domain-containing protein [Desulfovibrio subterraneus]